MTIYKHPRNSSQVEPPLTTTPENRRKFVVLVVLGSIIVVLLWVLTFRWNFEHRGTEAAGPRTFFGKIGETLTSSSRILDVFSSVGSALK